MAQPRRSFLKRRQKSPVRVYRAVLGLLLCLALALACWHWGFWPGQEPAVEAAGRETRPAPVLPTPAQQRESQRAQILALLGTGWHVAAWTSPEAAVEALGETAESANWSVPGIEASLQGVRLALAPEPATLSLEAESATLQLGGLPLVAGALRIEQTAEELNLRIPQARLEIPRIGAFSVAVAVTLRPGGSVATISGSEPEPWALVAERLASEGTPWRCPRFTGAAALGVLEDVRLSLEGPRWLLDARLSPGAAGSAAQERLGLHAAWDPEAAAWAWSLSNPERNWSWTLPDGKLETRGGVLIEGQWAADRSTATFQALWEEARWTLGGRTLIARNLAVDPCDLEIAGAGPLPDWHRLPQTMDFRADSMQWDPLGLRARQVEGRLEHGRNLQWGARTVALEELPEGLRAVRGVLRMGAAREHWRAEGQLVRTGLACSVEAQLDEAGSGPVAIQVTPGAVASWNPGAWASFLGDRWVLTGDVGWALRGVRRGEQPWTLDLSLTDASLGRTDGQVLLDGLNLQAVWSDVTRGAMAEPGRLGFRSLRHGRWELQEGALEFTQENLGLLRIGRATAQWLGARVWLQPWLCDPRVPRGQLEFEIDGIALAELGARLRPQPLLAGGLGHGRLRVDLRDHGPQVGAGFLEMVPGSVGWMEPPPDSAGWRWVKVEDHRGRVLDREDWPIFPARLPLRALRFDFLDPRTPDLPVRVEFAEEAERGVRGFWGLQIRPDQFLGLSP